MTICKANFSTIQAWIDAQPVKKQAEAAKNIQQVYKKIGIMVQLLNQSVESDSLLNSCRTIIDLTKGYPVDELYGLAGEIYAKLATIYYQLYLKCPSKDLALNIEASTKLSYEHLQAITERKRVGIEKHSAQESIETLDSLDALTTTTIAPEVLFFRNLYSIGIVFAGNDIQQAISFVVFRAQNAALEGFGATCRENYALANACIQYSALIMQFLYRYYKETSGLLTAEQVRFFTYTKSVILNAFCQFANHASQIGDPATICIALQCLELFPPISPYPYIEDISEPLVRELIEKEYHLKIFPSCSTRGAIDALRLCIEALIRRNKIPEAKMFLERLKKVSKEKKHLQPLLYATEQLNDPTLEKAKIELVEDFKRVENTYKDEVDPWIFVVEMIVSFEQPIESAYHKKLAEHLAKYSALKKEQVTDAFRDEIALLSYLASLFHHVRGDLQIELIKQRYYFIENPHEQTICSKLTELRKKAVLHRYTEIEKEILEFYLEFIQANKVEKQEVKEAQEMEIAELTKRVELLTLQMRPAKAKQVRPLEPHQPKAHVPTENEIAYQVIMWQPKPLFVYTADELQVYRVQLLGLTEKKKLSNEVKVKAWIKVGQIDHLVAMRLYSSYNRSDAIVKIQECEKQFHKAVSLLDSDETCKKVADLYQLSCWSLDEAKNVTDMIQASLTEFLLKMEAIDSLPAEKKAALREQAKKSRHVRPSAFAERARLKEMKATEALLQCSNRISVLQSKARAGLSRFPITYFR